MFANSRSMEVKKPNVSLYVEYRISFEFYCILKCRKLGKMDEKECFFLFQSNDLLTVKCFSFCFRKNAKERKRQRQRERERERERQRQGQRQRQR